MKRTRNVSSKLLCLILALKSISFSKKEPEYANPEDAASYEQNLTGDKEKDK